MNYCKIYKTCINMKLAFPCLVCQIYGRTLNRIPNLMYVQRIRTRSTQILDRIRQGRHCARKKIFIRNQAKLRAVGQRETRCVQVADIDFS